jgi:hypothetical protein
MEILLQNKWDLKDERNERTKDARLIGRNKWETAV